MNAITSGIIKKKYSYFFQTIDFPQRFFETPTLVTTTKHRKGDVNSHIDADNNAITEWIEVIVYKRFQYFLHQIKEYSFP